MRAISTTIQKYKEGHKDSPQKIDFKSPTIKNEIAKIIRLSKRDKAILAVIIFGSYARGEESKNSDVDVCLVMREGEYNNSYLTKKRIFYTNRVLDKIDVQIFQQLPLYIRIRVLREGKIIFVRNMNKLYETAIKTLRSFELFKPHYYSYLEGIEYG